MAQIRTPVAPEHDAVRPEQAGALDLPRCRPAGRAVGLDGLGLPCARHRHADRDRDGDEATRCRDVRAFEEDRRRIGVIGVPPPEERRRQIDRQAWRKPEPGLAKLRPVTEPPGGPLRGSPGRGDATPPLRRQVQRFVVSSGYGNSSGRACAMSREAGWALALLPSRGCMSWPGSVGRCCEVAGRAKIMADRCWQTMTAADLTSTADLRLRNRPVRLSGDEGLGQR